MSRKFSPTKKSAFRVAATLVGAAAALFAAPMTNNATRQGWFRKRATIVAALVVAALGGGVAWAAIPDGSGTITFCYVKGATDANGMSSVLLKDTAAGGCPIGFTPLTVSQRGIQGLPGPAGTPGATGATGPAGPSGPAGGIKHADARLGEPVHGVKNGHLIADATCPNDAVLTGGGWSIHNDKTNFEDFNFVVARDIPSGQQWVVDGINTGPDPVTLQVYAVCAQ